MSLTEEDVFYLYERNKNIYSNCKLLKKQCPSMYNNICYCNEEDDVIPLTIGDQNVKCKLNVKCYIKFGEECPVCLQEIIHKKNAYITGCGHSYHRLCLFKVFEEIRKKNSYSSLKCCICRCFLGFPDLFQKYNFNDNLFDQLENFWLSYDYIVPFYCKNKHYIGMDNNCKRCIDYRITGKY